ncbi:MAG: AbrB/MazE/SpoVT family DNA-binding domain-containing protein [Anaerolineae bacterium]|nr:AbrB/MazE/SpoVT family DNA-binding domain-containing protein [Anaerolineae bacterium]
MGQSDRKRFYGAVTVSERGQIVIPAEARRDFGIEVGDKLLVLGNLDEGIALAKASVLIDSLSNLTSLIQSVEKQDDEEDDKE